MKQGQFLTKTRVLWLCRDALLVYAALCALWVPLGLWVFPRRPLQLGQVHEPPFKYARQLRRVMTVAACGISRLAGVWAVAS
jgi:hypothetical protein